MVTDYSFLLQSIAWPMVLLLAWFIAERAYDAWRVPRVTSYVAVGLVGGLINLPGLTTDVPGLPFLANVALSLVLFELGYRINLRWFRHNPWVLLLGVVESIVTFGLIYWVSGWFDLPVDVGLARASAGLSLYFAAITLGRFGVGLVAHRMNNRQWVQAGLGLALAGASLMALPLPGLYGIAGLALMGLGCAPIFPSLMHETAVRFPAEMARTLVGRQMVFWLPNRPTSENALFASTASNHLTRTNCSVFSGSSAVTLYFAPSKEG